MENKFNLKTKSGRLALYKDMLVFYEKTRLSQVNFCYILSEHYNIDVYQYFKETLPELYALKPKNGFMAGLHLKPKMSVEEAFSAYYLDFLLKCHKETLEKGHTDTPMDEAEKDLKLWVKSIIKTVMSYNKVVLITFI